MRDRWMKCLTIILAIVLLATPLIWTAVTAEPDKVGYHSLQEGGDALRKYMVDRTETIDLSFYYNDARAMDSTQLMDVLLQEACKHTGKGTEGDSLAECFISYSYKEFADDFENGIHYVKITGLKFNYLTTADEEQALTQKVQQLFTELNIAEKTAYEKAEALYTYVCKNVNLSEDHTAGTTGINAKEYGHLFSAYSLVTGKAADAGFAALMYRLLLEAGLDCRIVSGEGRSWNVVKLGEQYYCLDASMDAGEDTFSWFLKGSAAFRQDGHWADTMDLLPVSPLDYGASATIQDSGRCGDNLDWTLTEDGTLTITGTGAMWNAKIAEGSHEWENISGEYWTGMHGYIKKVVISEGVTSVGNNAFRNCPQLAAVQFPGTLTAIGENAFALCDALETVTLPNSVKEVGVGAFSRCVGLKTATLSAGMTEVKETLFFGCTSLETITIPNGIVAIGRSAFEGCAGLKTCTLPETLTAIGDNAFAGAFDESAGVSVTIPKSVTEVGTACFAKSNVKTVKWLATADTVKIWTFYLCYYLEEVTLSDSVTKIETEAFFHCNALKTAELSTTLNVMGEAAFALCMSLERIALPGTLKEIPAGAFLDCQKLTAVTFAEGTEIIGGGAFLGCSLESVILPGTIKTLKQYALSCESLKSVTFSGDMPTIETDALGIVTGYYPGDNATWTSEKRIQYPNVNWVAGHGTDKPHTPTGEWCKDEQNHWKDCSSCTQKAELAAHVYSDACDTTCDTCGHVRAAVHAYDNDCDKDCNVCGATRATEHTYDNACDKDCNVCGAIRTTEHTYDNACDKDCNVCGATRTTEHVYDNGCDTTCNVCSAVRESAHTYDNSCDTTCNACEATRNITHTYDNDCDKDCNVCGATRTTEHAYTHDCDATCNICGQVRKIETTPLYRLYNPNTGEHLYTLDSKERDNLAAIGWNDEGIAGYVPLKGGKPIYRLYNPNSSDHHYTTDAEERDFLVTIGWIYEGVGWNTAYEDGVPLYRLFNPNVTIGTHHYTGFVDERDFLVSIGWIYEGVGWYGLPQ